MCWIEKEGVEVSKAFLADNGGRELSLIDKYLADFNLSCTEVINEGRVKNGNPRVTIFLRGDSADIQKFKDKFWN